MEITDVYIIYINNNIFSSIVYYYYIINIFRVIFYLKDWELEHQLWNNL